MADVTGVVVDELTTYPIEQIKRPARRWGRVWCHMFARDEASLPQLHAMAARLGLSRSYFQDHKRWQFQHDDLTPGKRAQALRLGVGETTARERGRQTADQLLAEAEV